ncbi:MAG: hypothetical protein GY822_25130 [Deltaproteobacteria bacterium]|nr:hypothetical protein [Deltaproteobacteria bacterium]
MHRRRTTNHFFARESGYLRALTLCIGLGVAAYGAGCGPTEKDGDGTSGKPSASTKDPAAKQSGADGDDGEDSGAPLEGSARSLSGFGPSITAVGSAGMNPNKISISFARPIARSKGIAKSGTALRIRPETMGTLKFVERDRLEFVPSKGFRSDTSYEIELLSVETGHLIAGKAEVLRHEKKTWTLRFKTPKLALHRLDVGTIKPRKQGEIDIVYTGPVRLHDVKANGAFYVGEMKAVGARYQATAKANVVRAVVSDPSLTFGSTIRFDQRKKVRSSVDDATAFASSRTLSLPGGDDVKLLSASPKEGSRGFSIDVVCSDDASSKPNRHFWDRTTRTSHRLSNRCQLNADALDEYVDVSPPVKGLSVSIFRGGFRLFGDFKRGTYRLRIDAGASSIDGGVVKKTFERDVVIPAKKPRVDFVAQGRYLPRSAWGKLAVRHLNVEHATLEVRHIRVENVHFWLSEYSEEASIRNSEIIGTKELHFGGKSDQQNTSFINLEEMIPKNARGVLQLRIRDKDKHSTKDARRIVLTDLNLVAKKTRSNGDVVVWAFGMEDIAPKSGVLFRHLLPSGKEISKCVTGAKGSCLLAGRKKNDVDPTQPSLIVATRGDDFTYLKYDELKAEAAGADVWGQSFSGQQKYAAAIYLDRGVYRPGDTAHFVAVVRDKDGFAPKEGMPVKLEVRDPRRKTFKRRVLHTNSAGMIFVDLPFGVYVDTGNYRINLDVAKRVVGQHSFNVEEFVPERIKVEPVIQKAAHLATDDVKVDVRARYLFGGSAKGARFELSCSVAPVSFKPSQNKDFSYAILSRDNGANRTRRLQNRAGVLEEGGEKSISCPTAESGAIHGGTLKLTAFASVFEAGSGRSSVGNAATLLHPEKYYLGLKADVQQVKVGNTFTLKGIVVDWEGKPVSVVKEVDVELLRLTHQYGWSYDEWTGSWRNRYHQREELDAKLKAKVDDKGAFSVSLTPQQYGSRYVVRATSGKARSDLSLRSNGYDYWWGYGSSSSDKTPRPQRATSLRLKVQEPLQVGKSSDVLMEAPFPGTVLFTIETDKVIHHEVKKVSQGPNKWPIQLKNFSPNVYVSALLLKDPHLDAASSFLPDRAYGVVSARVLPKAFTQQVKLSVKSEVRSNSTLDVEIELPGVTEKTFVTVAAVDEGILQLTQFKSPDPLASIFRKRALGVDTYETIGWNLLLPAQDVSSKTGVDASGDGAGRIQPVKPVALYSGVVEVPKSGKTKISLDVPEYRGSLRVMVVSVGAQKIGKASAEVLVRDPIVLQSTLPRFLMENDSFDVPVFLTNLSGKKEKVSVHVDVTPLLEQGGQQANSLIRNPVEWTGVDTKVVTLENNESATVRFSGVAKLAVGAAHVVVSANTETISVQETRDIPFSPDGPLVRTVKRTALKRGTTDVSKLLKGWTPTTESSTLWVTNNPYGDAFDHLGTLLRYPHGCIEQTTSKTRPLLFLANLVGHTNPALFAKDSVEKRVMAGVNRVFSMQTSLGGFSYWPGGTDPTHWGTAYATHMLLDALEAGYPVEKTRVDEAIAWMERELTHRYEKLSKSNNQYSVYKNSEPYFHYVVARAGRGRKGRILKLLEEVQKHPGGQARESEVLLKTALYYAGDRRFERDLKSPDISPISQERKNSWSFYSDRRRRGLVLSLFTELFGDDPAGDPLADVVAESLRGGSRYGYTTQEMVWSTTGLGRRLEKIKPLTKAPKLFVNGSLLGNIVKKKVFVTGDDGKRALKDTLERSWQVYRASEAKELNVEIDESDVGNAWLILSSKGLRPKTKWEVGGDGLEIRRQLYSTGWQALDASDGVELGEVVYVAVTVENKTGKSVQNLEVIDRLPAGFEVENPRLNRQGAPTRAIPAREKWTPDYMNLRDDRVEVFGSLPYKEKRTFIYAARATTAGEFAMPPVSVSAMYEPRIWSRKAGGRLTVRAPWTE